MKHGLVELVVHWFFNWVVVCSNLVGNETKLSFCLILFWHEDERTE